MAFAFVGFMAHRIRSLPEAAESNGLVDLATKAIGPRFGFACFLISFAAFFCSADAPILSHRRFSSRGDRSG